MKLYPWLTLVFMAAYSFVAISIALDYKKNHYAAAVGLSVLAFFMIVYFVTKAIKKQNP
jgi:L-asparagine transporter-like permease